MDGDTLRRLERRLQSLWNLIVEVEVQEKDGRRNLI